MRIAFVGKGGSGKTTFASLFTQFALEKGDRVWAIDADLNMHMAEQLNLDAAGLKHISDPAAEKDIKRYLSGENNRIEQLSHFKKTTPPGKGSNLVFVENRTGYVFEKYALRRGDLLFSIVGSYQADDIGASCYHNNLAVFESLLAHTVDKGSSVVVDMVAGVDAFAGTLHAQFDMVVLVTEPTKKSLEVYEQYKDLSEKAGVWEEVFVAGNKIASPKDAEFIEKRVDPAKIIGYLSISDHIKEVEQGESELDFRRLADRDKAVFRNIRRRLPDMEISGNERLARLHALHEKYVAQNHVKDRFGDLSGQIDPAFDFNRPAGRHG